MYLPFPQAQAFKICIQMIEELDCGKMVLEQLTEPSSERSGQGIMLGAAVCRTKDGKKVFLKTCSGISKELKRVCEEKNSEEHEIFVPPVVDSLQISSALRKNDSEIHSLTEKINLLKQSRKLVNGKYLNQTQEEKDLCHKRIDLCNESLERVYNLYEFWCADGKKHSLKEMCKGKLPPTGTGDCCAPKLLNYAFKHNMAVLSMAETFYGAQNTKKEQGKLYSPCDERCGLILPFMLGLNILYQDSNIVVVNKQSGLLSVPGKGPLKQDCIVNRLKRLFPDCIEQPSVHRLDMETSGLMVLALTAEAHRELNRQFENRVVQKEYVALIDGVKTEPKTGTMELYFRVDIDNRPHQIWDRENGKNAITEWELLGEETYIDPENKKRQCTRVRFIPHTGRTHQLRLAASDSHGFGIPIIGDTLYGTCKPGERLMLHAKKLSFIHPITQEPMSFTCESDF